jgi:hypothetical protein
MAYDQEAVEKILSAARAAVAAAKVPKELQPLAFGKAVDLLAGSAAPSESRPPSGGKPKEDGSDGKTGDSGTEEERLEKIARRTGVDLSKLAYIYDLDDDDVNLVIQRSKLATSKAVATREIALLYCSARQAGGYDETHTPVSSIRQRVDDMGVLDTANFSTSVRNVDGMTGKGTRQNREFKVTQHGYEEAGKLITRLTGGGS